MHENQPMKRLLERLKLIDYLTTEIRIERKAFVDRLTKNVDPGSTGFVLFPFEAFRSSKNEYTGLVTYDGFKIRKRRKMFDSAMTWAIAEGTFRQKEDRMVVESTIIGFRGSFIPILILILLFYLAFIISFAMTDSEGSMGWFIFPFLLVHAAFMLGIPYFIMRRGVAKMKYDLERDLYFLTKET